MRALAINIAAAICLRTTVSTVNTTYVWGGSGLLATRIRGFKSIGDFPDFQYFGGNSELRGYDYLQFAGQNVLFANAELRFPLIEAALTPIGVIGDAGAASAEKGEKLLAAISADVAEALTNDRLWSEPI